MTIMSRPAVVVEIHFRITDDLRDYNWDLDENLRFKVDNHELQIQSGDQIIAHENVDVRNLTANAVKLKLMKVPYTKFTSITLLKKGQEDHASVVFGTEDVRNPFESTSQNPPKF